nr:hypothetical protein [Tanacetum cinerariifolium]
MGGFKIAKVVMGGDRWHKLRGCEGLVSCSSRVGQRENGGKTFGEDEERVRLQGLGTYTDDQIMAMVRRGKQRGHIPGVGRVLTRRGKDVLDVPVPRCNHTSDLQSQHESESGSGCGVGEDDESGDDEDADEDADS